MCRVFNLRSLSLLAVVPLGFQVACLDASYLSGKACDEDDRCLDGYVCDPHTRKCVPPDELDAGVLDGDDGRTEGGDEGPCPEEPVCEGDTLVSCDPTGAWQREPCHLGCLPEPEPARCRRLFPSNFGEEDRALLCASNQALSLEQATTIDTDTGVITHGQEVISPDVFEVITGQEDAPGLAVFAFDRVEIRAGVRARVSGGRALVILACTDIEIAGTLDVSGAAGEMRGDAVGVAGAGGPGAFRGGEKGGGDGLGPGAGRGGTQAPCDARPDTGGAGGGFGGPGGAGGNGDANDCEMEGPEGGTTCGVPDLVPLQGGSGGGGGGDPSGGPGGGGGGAVQLSAGAQIEIQAGGGILAGGGAGAGGHDGEDASAGGGGGSGGAILIEAAVIEIAGTLAANGGGGGAGYPDNAGWTDLVAESGTSGQLSAEPAPGGTSQDLGGTGGAGSGGAQAAGTNGQDRENGGGGGGGAGRIRLNTATGEFEAGEPAVISPSETQIRCGGLCTRGIVQRW